MSTRTAHELRTEWGSAIRAVTDHENPEHLEISRTRGKVTEKPGVLVDASWWSAAVKRFPVDPEQVQISASKQVRTDLRRTLNAAAAGIHTKITVFSDVEAVMVPSPWYEKVCAAEQAEETAK